MILGVGLAGTKSVAHVVVRHVANLKRYCSILLHDLLFLLLLLLSAT